VSDEAGLAEAYSSTSGFSKSGHTLYVAGTRWNHGLGTLVSDVIDDVRLPFTNKILGTRSTNRYAETLLQLKANPDIDRLVGHSLGAQAARQAATDLGIDDWQAYAMPSFNFNQDSDPRRHRHYGDPVSMFDSAAAVNFSDSFNPHSYGGYTDLSVSP